MTLVMVVMICIGCAAIVASLVYLGIQVWRLLKTTRSLEPAAAKLEGLLRKGELLAPRVEKMAERQKEVAERLDRLSATTAALTDLKDLLDDATGHVSGLKS